MLSCKSFYNIGNSLPKCFGCKYCLIKGLDLNNEIYPEDRTIPVSVNLFYGDPMLQIDNTLKMLKELEDRKHTGIVFMATKGDYTKFKEEFNLNLWVGLSTFNINHDLDGGSIEQFKKNLEHSTTLKNNHLIEYRPIITNVNDNPDFVIEMARKYNYSVSYDGLKENNWEVEREVIKKLNKVHSGRDTLKLIVHLEEVKEEITK